MFTIGTAAQTLHDEITRLHAAADKPDIKTRITIVTDLIEAYWDDTQTLPPPHALKRLADYLLVDDLTDVHKRNRGYEYPFHSGLQTNRRKQHEVYDPNVGRF